MAPEVKKEQKVKKTKTPARVIVQYGNIFRLSRGAERAFLNATLDKDGHPTKLESGKGIRLVGTIAYDAGQQLTKKDIEHHLMMLKTVITRDRVQKRIAKLEAKLAAAREALKTAKS